MPLRHLFLPAVLFVLSAWPTLLRGAGPMDYPAEQSAIALARVMSAPTAPDAVRLQACDMLKSLGPRAAIAAPVLIEAFRRPEPMPTHATAALLAIGPDAIPALRAAMKLEERETFAASGLTWAAIDVKAGVPLKTMLRRLDTGETIERYAAALAIGRWQQPIGLLHIVAGGKAEGQGQDFLSTLAALMQAKMNDPSIVVRDAANVALDMWRERAAGREPRLPAADWLSLAPEVQWDRDYRKELIKQTEAGDNRDRISAMRRIARYGSDAHDVAGAVRKYLDDPDAGIREAAYDTLHAMGDTALPQWLDALKSRNASARRLAMIALADPWLNKFASRETLARQVEGVLNDPDQATRGLAAVALCALWPESEPALTRAMKSGNDAVKQMVIQQLLEKGGDLAFRPPADKDANAPPVPTPPISEEFAEFEAQVSPDLYRSLSSEDLPFGGRAFEALRQFRSSKARRRLVEVLQAQLGSHSPELYRDAARKLLRLGTEALPALIAGMQSRDYFTRAICATGLVEQAQLTNDAKTVAAATAALGDRAEEVRDVALAWVEKLREPPPGVVETLAVWMSPPADAFTDRISSDEQARAVAILGQWAVEPKTSVPAITHGLENGEQQKVQLAAIRALRAFGADAEAAAPQIARFLDQANAPLAQAATETLAVLGPEGRRAAVGFLIRVLKSRVDGAWSPWAIKNLAAIGPGASAAAPALAALLAESDNDLRAQVALALGSIGPEARAAIPALTRMADNRDPDVRQAASESLLRISPDGKGLGPALIAAVMNRDRACADRLAAVMQRSGEAQAMRVRLIDLADTDPDTRVRATAQRATEFLSSK